MINRVKFCDYGNYEEQESLIKRKEKEVKKEKEIPVITGNDVEDRLLYESKFDLSSLALPNGYIRRKLCSQIELSEEYNYLSVGDTFCFLLNEEYKVLLNEHGTIESSENPVLFVEGEIGNEFNICYMKDNYMYIYSTVCFKNMYEMLKEYLDNLFYCEFTIKQIDEFYEEFDYTKCFIKSTFYKNDYMDCYMRNSTKLLQYNHRFLRYDRNTNSYTFSNSKEVQKGDLVVYRIGNSCIVEMREEDYMMLIYGREYKNEVIDTMVLRAWKMLG